MKKKKRFYHSVSHVLIFIWYISVLAGVFWMTLWWYLGSSKIELFIYSGI